MTKIAEQNLLALISSVRQDTEIELGNKISGLSYNVGALDNMDAEIKACRVKGIGLLRKNEMLDDISIFQHELKKVFKVKHSH